MAKSYFNKKEYLASIYCYQQALEKVTVPRFTSGWAGKLHYQLAQTFLHLYSSLPEDGNNNQLQGLSEYRLPLLEGGNRYYLLLCYAQYHLAIARTSLTLHPSEKVRTSSRNHVLSPSSYFHQNHM